MNAPADRPSTSRRPGPLLVIAHEATRTGAPRVLLDLLAPLAGALPGGVRVRLESGGPLAEDLLALDTRAGRAEAHGNDAGDDAGDAAPAAVLVNSALAAETALELPGIPAALYVHEDRGGIDALPARAREAIAARYALVLCVSDQARDDLVGVGVPPERIRVVPPLVAAPTPHTAGGLASARAALGAAPDDLVLLGCGEGGWRKGADLFVATARRILDEAPPDRRAVFGWVGLRPRPFARRLDHDVALLGLDRDVHWLGEVDDAGAFLEAADVLVMPSRNDPQPLVPIEAALLGTPTVGFAVGGLRDLDRAGAAATVAFGDVPALAATARRVATTPAEAAALVEHGRRRWRERQSPAVVVPAFRAVLDELRALDPAPTSLVPHGGDPWP